MIVTKRMKRDRRNLRIENTREKEGKSEGPGRLGESGKQGACANQKTSLIPAQKKMGGPEMRMLVSLIQATKKKRMKRGNQSYAESVRTCTTGGARYWGQGRGGVREGQKKVGAVPSGSSSDGAGT